MYQFLDEIDQAIQRGVNSEPYPKNKILIKNLLMIIEHYRREVDKQESIILEKNLTPILSKMYKATRSIKRKGSTPSYISLRDTDKEMKKIKDNFDKALNKIAIYNDSKLQTEETKNVKKSSESFWQRIKQILRIK